MASDASSDDRAVRDYLLYLEDPLQLVDVGAADELKQAAKRETDPLQRLRVLGQVDRLRNPDGNFRKPFLERARRWAATNGVTASAFAAIGCPTTTWSPQD